MPNLGASFGIDTSAEGLANTAETLSNYLDANDTHTAIAAIQNLPDGAAGAVESIVSTGKVNLTTAGPLIAAGLAATGVGAPAAAIVAAGLPIVTSIGTALGLFGNGGDDRYDFYVASPSVTMAPRNTNPNGYGRNGHVPYGPGDPAWETADSFLPDGMGNGYPAHLYPPNAAYSAIYGALGEKGNHNLDMLKAFPEWALIRNDITMIDKRPMSTGMRDFYKAYYGAWKANAEKLWNGHKGVAPSTLLSVVAAAWNRSHSTSKTETIKPAGDWNAFKTGSAEGFLSSPTFIEALLGGLVDGADEPPLTLNMGSFAPPPKRVIALKLAPSPPPPPPSVTASADMKTNPAVLAPVMLYVTGQKFATNDPQLLPAVAAARIAGVDPSRWALLTAAQRNFVTNAGFAVSSKKGTLDGLSRSAASSAIASRPPWGVAAIVGAIIAAAAFFYRRNRS